MEKKTKHRIFGILVVVGLVIITLPFFQGGGRESDSVLVNAPAFPDQSVQVETSQPAENNTQAAPVQTSPIPMHDPSADNGINQLPDDTIAPNAGMPSSPAQTPSMTPPENGLAVPNTENNNDVSKATPDEDNAPPPTDTEDTLPAGKSAQHINEMMTGSETAAISENPSAQMADKIVDPSVEKPAVVAPKVRKAQIIKKDTVATPKMRSAAYKPAANDVNGLIKLKQSVWVIQLGSFKNKENALRLVNNLRKKGYHAFIQQVDARTRVFVGPEQKQPIARMVASQLEEDMHISGVVISYKPLAL